MKGMRRVVLGSPKDYSATEVARRSRLVVIPFIWLFETKAKPTSVIFERHLILEPQGNQVQQSPQGCADL